MRIEIDGETRELFDTGDKIYYISRESTIESFTVNGPAIVKLIKTSHDLNSSYAIYVIRDNMVVADRCAFLTRAEAQAECDKRNGEVVK